MIGIYKITNPKGDIYIGQSLDIDRRKYEHEKDKRSSHLPLKSSIIEYGWKQHKFDIVHELPQDVTKEVLDNYEILYIDLYRSCGIVVLNVREGGSFGTHSEETKKKLSEKGKGNKRLLGHKHSEETKLKMSISHIGLNTWIKGRKWTEQEKLNASIARTGKSHKKKDYRHSPERIEQIRLFSTGRVKSQETKDKISNSKKGKPRSEETKLKVSEGLKRYFQNKKLNK